MSAFGRRPVERHATSSSSTTNTSTSFEATERNAIITATRRATPQEYANAFGHFTEANIEEQGLGGGSHQRTDGVHGLGSRGSMVAGGGNGGQSGARDAARNQATMSAAQRAHGGSFGGQRLWGDGSGEAFFGEGPGMRDGRGHASSATSELFSEMAKASRSTRNDEKGNDRGSTGSSAVASDIGGGNSLGGIARAASEITSMFGAAASMVSSVFGGGASAATIGAGGATSSGAATGVGGSGGASAKRPREDQDTAGNVVLGAADGHAQGVQIVRAMSRHGRGDGRGERDTSTASTGGATTTQRERAGGERATDASGGAVNWDLALEIDQLVNPGAG
jgi:hypothetical protein